MDSNICLFLLIFAIINATSNGKYTEIVENIIKGQWLHDEDGNLTIAQHYKMGKAKETTIFFKGKSTDCNEGIGGVYFDILACIPYERTGNTYKCPNGKMVKDDKYVMHKVNKQFDCGKDNYDHSLHIDINLEKNTANIISSIDINTYTIKLPKLVDFGDGDTAYCFKIRVGTADSVQTLITDIDGNKIDDIEPSLPEFKLNDLMTNGWSNSKKNFHLFALDFIPKLNKWRQKYGDYYKTLFFRGTREQCNLTLQFIGEKLHRCYAEWIDTSMICPGPYRTDGFYKCNLNPEPKDDPTTVKCKFGSTITEETTKASKTRDIMNSGFINEIQDYRTLRVLGYSSISPFVAHSEYKYNIYKSHQYHEFEQATYKNETHRTTVTGEWEIYVSEGCITVVQELYVNCNGWREKIGQFRHATGPYKADDYELLR